ncbi:MAG: STAS domain-containing protein [Alphaproteobacteria bacterium]|nr:STAS domain-containing protein [Alphaproteobacteria bacterium]
MYNIQQDGDNVTLVLSGDVDLQTTADLKSEISELVGIATLDVKAGQVSYIDSSGVAVLLMTRQHCMANGIELTLSTISTPVFRVLQIAKLDKLLPIGEIIDTDGAGSENFGIDAAGNGGANG